MIETKRDDAGRVQEVDGADPRAERQPQVAGAAVANLGAGVVGRKFARRLMRKATEEHGLRPGAEEAVERASASGGEGLPTELRQKFEQSLGVDLGGVRVHHGGHSMEAARSVNARAYTIGQDIHFGDREYDPSSRSGEELLAHEVAHTVQQAGASDTHSPQYKLEASTSGNSMELEADAAARHMMEGKPAAVRTGTGARLSRWELAGSRWSPTAGGTPIHMSSFGKVFNSRGAETGRATFGGFGEQSLSVQAGSTGKLQIYVAGNYLDPTTFNAFHESQFATYFNWDYSCDAAGMLHIDSNPQPGITGSGNRSPSVSSGQSGDGVGPGYVQMNFTISNSATAPSVSLPGPHGTSVSDAPRTSSAVTGDRFRLNIRVTGAQAPAPAPVPTPAPAPSATAVSASSATATATSSASATAVVNGPAALPLPSLLEIHFPYGRAHGDPAPISRWVAQLPGVPPADRERVIAAMISGRLVVRAVGSASAPGSESGNRRIARRRASWVGQELGRALGAPRAINVAQMSNYNAPSEDRALPHDAAENLAEQRVDVTVAESGHER